MTIPPNRTLGDPNHVPDHHDINGELTTNKEHREDVDNPHETTFAQLGDVDVSTPPTGGQAPLWDESEEKWVPGTVASEGGGSVAVERNGTEVVEAAAALNFVGKTYVVDDGDGEVSVGQSALATPPHPTAGSFHFPAMDGDVEDFGTFQRLYFVPFEGNGGTLNSVHAFVDTEHASGLLRFGLYHQVDPTAVQLDLIADFGTVAATSTGRKSITGLSQVLAWGKDYWIGVAIQGNSAVKVRGGYPTHASQRRMLSFVGTRPSPMHMGVENDVTAALPEATYPLHGSSPTEYGLPWVFLAFSAES